MNYFNNYEQTQIALRNLTEKSEKQIKKCASKMLAMAQHVILRRQADALAYTLQSAANSQKAMERIKLDYFKGLLEGKADDSASTVEQAYKDETQKLGKECRKAKVTLQEAARRLKRSLAPIDDSRVEVSSANNA